MTKRNRIDSTWSIKYEFSCGPQWLAFWYGTWAFISNRKDRARFNSKEEAQEALLRFQRTWYRPIGQTRPYVIVRTWKHGKRPDRPTARISTLQAPVTPTYHGPWEKEKDSVQWISRRSGLPMMIRRSPEGYLRGLVGIPRGNYLYGARDELLTVHGGVSFCGRSDDGDFTFPDSDMWWFGFHAGHCTDVIPQNPVRVFHDSSYKTVAFMRRQCEKLGEQIRRFDILAANVK